MAGDGSSSDVAFGNGLNCVVLKENVMCLHSHANLEADVLAPNKGILIESVDFSRGG